MCLLHNAKSTGIHKYSYAILNLDRVEQSVVLPAPLILHERITPLQSVAAPVASLQSFLFLFRRLLAER